MAKTNDLTEIDAKTEAAIEQLRAEGRKVTKAAVQSITGGSNSTVLPSFDRVMARRSAAVEPTAEASKLFSQLWGEALAVARVEDADKDKAIDEMSIEIERLNGVIESQKADQAAIRQAADETIAKAHAEAEAAVQAAHAQAQADEKATAVLRAERDLIAADKAKLEAQVQELQEKLQAAEIERAATNARLETYRDLHKIEK